jgi:hypothetical protein
VNGHSSNLKADPNISTLFSFLNNFLILFILDVDGDSKNTDSASLIPSYGVLRIEDENKAEYSQIRESGEIENHKPLKLKKKIEVEYEEETNTNIIIAFIVLGACLAFMGYFVYSWIKCYKNKPKIIEDHDLEKKDPPDLGYDMRKIQDDL